MRWLLLTSVLSGGLGLGCEAATSTGSPASAAESSAVTVETRDADPAEQAQSGAANQQASAAETPTESDMAAAQRNFRAGAMAQRMNTHCHPVVAGLRDQNANLQEMMDCFAEDPSRIHAANELGITALHLAVRSQDIRVVEALVSLGAKKDALTKDGLSPLDAALLFGNTQAAKLLEGAPRVDWSQWRPAREPGLVAATDVDGQVAWLGTIVATRIVDGDIPKRDSTNMAYLLVTSWTKASSSDHCGEVVALPFERVRDDGPTGGLQECELEASALDWKKAAKAVPASKKPLAGAGGGR
jgi:hypothetical protein